MTNEIQKSNGVNALTLHDVSLLAETVVKSGLFANIQTKQQAFTLMMLCQAEGIHPMKAMQRYHIIQGKPSKQAHAMLADFQKAGGKVKWLERTDAKCSAKFSHPNGGEAVIEWTMDRAVQAGVAGKDTWKKYPTQMLAARVVSEGVNAVYPAAAESLYPPEIVQDFKELTQPPEDQKPKPEQAKAEVVEEKKTEPVDTSARANIKVYKGKFTSKGWSEEFGVVVAKYTPEGTTEILHIPEDKLTACFNELGQEYKRLNTQPEEAPEPAQMVNKEDLPV